MSKKTPEEQAKAFAEKRAKVAKELGNTDDIFMNFIGRTVCDMLKRGETVTCDSLLNELAGQHEEFSKVEKREYNTGWHRLNAAIEHLKNLNK